MSRSSDAVKRWRSATKYRMIAAMGNKCQCCGYSACSSALAFHHLDPGIKDRELSDTRANPKNWLSIVSELRKCILVCHNCHSEIHAGVRTIPIVYASFDESFVDYKEGIPYNNCTVCNSLKLETHKFCSPTCAATNRRKVDWDNIDLIQLMKEHTIGTLEDMLGVSNAAIYKRRDKILAK